MGVFIFVYTVVALTCYFMFVAWDFSRNKRTGRFYFAFRRLWSFETILRVVLALVPLWFLGPTPLTGWQIFLCSFCLVTLATPMGDVFSPSTSAAMSFGEWLLRRFVGRFDTGVKLAVFGFAF